ncbi:conjugal transfer protein TraF [Vibrio hangzhouensis]|uniref:Plasmid transfer operon, TraF, protein n=1 Tax=Vibrio hangzhouensis TaxID=462991 RepID=A0A1H5TA31_9VIBR|nr:conjugal transfer protein TraF [Vibrio hangzhouensis]SEF59656.1 plasmid transfer operon, TraF, protein [Vibrio hangzhouensis]
MKRMTLLAMSVLTATTPFISNAANNMIEARGAAMGNTGVASADYLTAGLYNPALAASFHESDDVGLLLPTLGGEGRDSDDSISTLNDLQSLIERYESDGQTDPDILTEINRLLDQLEGNKPTTVTATLGFALAIPSHLVSTNLYARGYAEAIAAPIIVKDSYTSSLVQMQAFASAELGLAMGKSFTIANQDVSFGITPKFQKLRTYALIASVADFDADNAEDSMVEKSAFNFDLGAAWNYNNWRMGLAVRDILAQEVDVNNVSGQKIDTYKLNPMVTVGTAYNGEFITAAVDIELTKQERFASLNDETQYLRFGIEGNAWDWAQLRAGYEVDMQDNADSAITAGIGLSPFDVVSLDLAGSYAGSNQVGASANLAFTF